MSIEETITRLRQDWSVARSPLNSDPSMPDFALVCTFADRGVSVDTWQDAVNAIPDGVRTFWEKCERAKLFEDANYGQWGLEILSAEESVRETMEQRKSRPDDFEPSDLVIGRFIGDSDLLVVRCDSSASDFGAVVVALPLDPREDWDRVANSFEEFLETYANTGGEKYWEAQV